PTEAPVLSAGTSALKVAVLDLGVRRSDLRQLDATCSLELFPHDADAASVLEARPAGVFVSDGPGGCLPPACAVEIIGDLVGQVPILACGLGHVALGMAVGCEPEFLKRGHHGANYPVRNLADGSAEVTQQRHTVALGRDSVEASAEAALLCENINDGTVEGIQAADGSAVGFQPVLAAPQPGALNRHVEQFVQHLAAR
ncbi:MAG: glutamine amidotransferase-related protein, partial [Planctomycetota bacterium]